MALAAYLSIVAERHGPVKGSVTQKGREGKSLVYGARHEIVSPRDPMNGRPTGKRAHKPLILTKQVDRASPILEQILCSNENIVNALVEFWITMPNGSERARFAILLRNANVAAIHLKMPSIRSEKLVRLPEHEDVWFTYQRIEWTWVDANISAADDWDTPR
jgi:type VI secretion system secreted protein Hcp